MRKIKIIIPGQKTIVGGQRIRKLFVIENRVAYQNQARNRDPERRNKFK